MYIETILKLSVNTYVTYVYHLLPGQPFIMLIGKLFKTTFRWKPINVLPKLSNSFKRLVGFKAEATDLVINKSCHHFEFHAAIITQIHVLYQVSICCSVQSKIKIGYTYVSIQSFKVSPSTILRYSTWLVSSMLWMSPSNRWVEIDTDQCMYT